MDTQAGEAGVAVVMITRNRVRDVIRTLGELERLPEKPRVVVINNGSDDGTSGAVAECFPEVEVINTGSNLGAAARTIGVQYVDAPFVAFCDDDTWWEAGSLRLAVQLFEAQPRLAVVTGRVLVGPEQREDQACGVLARSPLPREVGMPGPSLLGFLAGASVVRRSAFLEVGGFEPRFFIGGEEELLAADLAARHWWLCYVPELIVHHHPSPLRDASTRRITTARNALWFSWLRRPLPVALRTTWQIAWQRPRSRDTRMALIEGLRGLPWVLRERRVLPPEVEQGLRLLEAQE